METNYIGCVLHVCIAYEQYMALIFSVFFFPSL